MHKDKKDKNIVKVDYVLLSLGIQQNVTFSKNTVTPFQLLG